MAGGTVLHWVSVKKSARKGNSLRAQTVRAVMDFINQGCSSAKAGGVMPEALNFHKIGRVFSPQAFRAIADQGSGGSGIFALPGKNFRLTKMAMSIMACEVMAAIKPE